MLHEAMQIIHNNQANQKQIRKRQDSAKENKKMQISTQNMTRSAPQFKTLTFGSSITVHKLRESKWFGFNEMKILLSVVESGFILEKRDKETNESKWGIAIWEPGQEKSKNINHIEIYSLTGEKDKIKVSVQKLDQFWSEDNEIRINNHHDKEKQPNIEEDIRKQIEYAVKNKSQKWHNEYHFPYFCRYEKPIHGRIHQISERVRWNSFGVNLGMLMRGRNRRPTAN